jgi:hypothetical protein
MNSSRIPEQRRLHPLSQSMMQPQTMSIQQQQQLMMHRSLSPQNNSTSSRHLNDTRKTAFPSGERGNRYTSNPTNETIHNNLPSDASKRQLMQQQRMYRSMNLPSSTNTSLRMSYEESQNAKLQMQQQQMRSMHLPSLRMSHDEQSRDIQRSIQLPRNKDVRRSYLEPSPRLPPRRRSEDATAGNTDRASLGNLSKSCVMNHYERRSFHDVRRISLKNHYVPKSNSSFHSEKKPEMNGGARNGLLHNNNRNSFRFPGSIQDLNDSARGQQNNSSFRFPGNNQGLNDSARSGLNGSARGQQKDMRPSPPNNLRFPNGNYHDLNNSARSGLNQSIKSLNNSARSGLNGSARSQTQHMSARDMSIYRPPHNNTHHSSLVIPKRKSWINENDKVRNSMGNVLTQSELHLLQPPDENEDLTDDDLNINDEGPMQLTKSYTSQTYRSSLTVPTEEKNGETCGDGLKSFLPKRNNATNNGWKTLSEDDSHIRYRRWMMCAICGVVGIGGIIATAIFLAPFDTDNLNSNEVDDTPKDTSLLPWPVRDIEGRCSPSNIHGSVSSCVEACTVAACCYPDFSGESCYDEKDGDSVEACLRYRPHCDAIFAPWADALEGGVAPPPETLFSQDQWDEVCSGASGITFVRMPLKRRHPSRSLLSDTLITPSICALACSPGKCCFSQLSSTDADLFITSDGVVMNATSGDHVETSCLTENNLERCMRYNEKCGTLMQNQGEDGSVGSPVDTLNPTAYASAAAPMTSIIINNLPTSPSSSTTPPVTIQDNVDAVISEAARPQSKPTSKPSENPSSKPTTPPTQTAPSIPLPNINEIKNACTGAQTILDIVEGVLNTVMACQRVCQPGQCCFSDSGSCFETNRDICLAYSDCLVLSMTTKDVAAVDADNIVPPNPTADLAQFCSTSSTPAGVLECVKACQPASCCGATDPASSCFDNYEETCGLYGSCLELTDAHGGDTKSIPPAPPTDLDYICSYSVLNVDSSECTLACSAGICCLDNSCPPFDEEEALQERCQLYDSCVNLLDMPMPSDELLQLCDDTSLGYNEQVCADACTVSECCFNNNDPCFTNFEESCNAYAPHCAPAFEESDVVRVELQSPPPDLSNLCKGASASQACQQACSIGACCFLLSEDDNCWKDNEQICGEYAICAFLYQDYQETFT